MKKDNKTATRTCVECGGRLRRWYADHKVDLTPGWLVTVENAERWTCTKCGREELAVWRWVSLERVVLGEVLRKSAPLAGHEIGFLAGCFEISRRELANLLGVTPETLSRYEHGSRPISATADRLLRLLVASAYLHDQALATACATRRIEGKAGASLKITVFVDPKGEYQVKGGGQAARHSAAA